MGGPASLSRGSRVLLLAAVAALVVTTAPSVCAESHQIKKLVETPVRSSLLAQLSVAFPSVNASCQCSRQTQQVVRAALAGRLWALRWVDASARPPSGLLSGNVNQLGDYDECLGLDAGDAVAPEDDGGDLTCPVSDGGHQTSYCLASVALDVPDDADSALGELSALLHSYTPFRSNFSDPGHRVPRFSAAYLGVCVPASCTPSEVQAGLEAVLNSVAGASEDGVSVRASVTPEMCRAKDQSPPAEGFGAWLARTTLWWTVAAVVLATFIDVVSLDGEGPENLLRYTNCLSMRQNWRRLVSTSDEQLAKGEVAVLHGVRGVNALGLLVAHKSVALLYEPYVNRTPAVAILGMSWSIVGRVAILYTDCFILLSGVLAAKAILRQLDRTGTVPLLRRLVDRYVRLTPLLAALIVLCTLVLPGLGGGPMWGMVVEPHAALCRRHWWRNVLYIHNYYGFEDMCLTHTHQLGIDMQLFLAAPLLVYPLWRWPRAGAALLSALAAWSTGLRYGVVLEHKLSTIVYFGMPVSQMFKTASLSYILPTHRLTVYIMGVALGYALHRVPASFRLSSTSASLGWAFFATLGLLPVFGPHHAGTPAYNYDALEAAQYAAFAPILWSAFVCWGVFAIARGSGGWLRDLMCWRGWAVFTRVAFALYLTQFPVFFYNVGSTRQAGFYTIRTLLNIGEFTVIFIISIILSLTFEMPFQELWKIFNKTTEAAESTTPPVKQLPPKQPLKSIPKLERKLA